MTVTVNAPPEAKPGQLTRFQAGVVRAIWEHIRTHGTAPNYEELANRLGLRSRSGVMNHVRHLVAAGWLHKVNRRTRSIALPGVRMVPVIDDSADGQRLKQLLGEDHA